MNRLKKTLQKQDPYITAAGKLVEQITNVMDLEDAATLDVLDPAVSQLCQLITMTDGGSKDAMKAIRSRMLHSASRSQPQLLRTLTLLDLLVSNCDSRMHLQVASQKFLDDLKTTLSPKNSITDTNRQRIFAFLEAWCAAFRGRPELNSVEQFCNAHVRPNVASETTHAMRRAASRPTNPPSTHAPPQYTRMTTAPVQRTAPEAIKQLEEDLDTITNNMIVFHDILNVADASQLPNYTDIVSNSTSHNSQSVASQPDWDSAQAIVTQCRTMQARLHELFEWLNAPPQAAAGPLPEALLARVFEVNDDLTGMFERAATYNVEARAKQQRSTAASRSSPPAYAAATSSRNSRNESAVAASNDTVVAASNSGAAVRLYPSVSLVAGSESNSNTLTHQLVSMPPSSAQASAAATGWTLFDEPNQQLAADMLLPSTSAAPLLEFDQLTASTRPKTIAAPPQPADTNTTAQTQRDAQGDQSSASRDDLISF